MKIKIGKKEWSSSGSVMEIMNEIEMYLTDNNLFLNHMLIDGVEVYEEFEKNIAKQENTNTEIEVFALTYEEIINYLKKDFQAEGKRIQENAESLSQKLYSLEVTSKNIEELLLLLEETHNFYKLIHETINGNYAEWQIPQDFFAGYTRLISIFSDAMEEKDNVYIADLLCFELVPEIEHIINGSMV